MSGSDAPEAVGDTANYPEAVWTQRRDPQQQHKQSYTSSQAAPPYGYAATESNAYYSDVEPKRTATICGISRALFIALVILAVVIIGAAVGGGVGGSMAVRYVVCLMLSIEQGLSSLFGWGNLR